MLTIYYDGTDKKIEELSFNKNEKLSLDAIKMLFQSY